MSDQNLLQSSLNTFFEEIYLKKQYFKKMQNKVLLFNKVKEANYKKVSLNFHNKLRKPSNFTFVMYIVEISFSKKNTLFHVSDCLGNLKFFYSAGSFQQKGRGKRFRSMLIKNFLRMLISKLRFLKKRIPLALHLKNVNFISFRFLKRLREKFTVNFIKYFNQYSYNGCRTKKIRRKKFKKRLKINF